MTTVASTRLAFAQLTQQMATYSQRDDLWSLAQLQALHTSLVNVNGVNFHGFTQAQYELALAEFITNAAQNFSNNKTDFGTSTTTHGNTPRAVPYNNIKAKIKAQGKSVASLIGTFATEVYNTMVANDRPPLKWMEKGYHEDDRFVAFPGAHHIDNSRAVPKLTEGNLVAIAANKKAIIWDSYTSAMESHSTNPLYTSAQTTSSSASSGRRPTPLMITNS